ncbi:ankyrin repeat protein [Reticulomyxa filosa]|uniref:Ankyrin repeat protein n=1 Tax=Reticulomyxa filosa TaxID=46433 RepID=X6MNM5_RETFI|nr:ankyrin repeat protein [Reticulomyxa filosa]|eukprot:ETO15032.1 ankyrin repeat protein [Reticulomyxa filosa]
MDEGSSRTLNDVSGFEYLTSDDENDAANDVEFDESVDVDGHKVAELLEVIVSRSIRVDSRLLLLAVRRDWPHVILSLGHAKTPVDMNVRGKDGITPLMLAAREGRLACLQALLQSGKVDIDAADDAQRTAVMHAAYRGQLHCVQKLLKMGASIDVETVDGTTLLMASCYGGLAPVAQLLLNNGAEVDAANANGFTALLFAASEGSQECVNVLLQAGANINIASQGLLTTLMAASSGGLPDFVVYLLTHGRKKDLESKDENGWTALMHAAVAGEDQCAAILLKAGADINVIGTDGFALLSVAVVGNLVWLVRHILEHGDRRLFNHKDSHLMSPVHEACSTGNDQCLKVTLFYYYICNI